MKLGSVSGVGLALALLCCVPAGTGVAAGTDIPDGDYVIGPDYTPASELASPMAALRGSIHPFTMAATDSKLYPGIRRKPGYKFTNGPGSPMANAPFDVASEAAPYYPRHVEVYLPAGTRSGATLPYMVVLDGVWLWGIHDPVIQAVDAMIAAKRLPPIALVMIDPGNRPVDPAAMTRGLDSPTEDAPGSERSLEYDTVSSRFGDFVESEVLPKAESVTGVRFTKDPDGRAVYGISSSGVAALSMAWFHPERYHRVMIYSGTFINNQNPLDPELPHGAWEYHEHLIPNAPKKPIRIWLEVGGKDGGYATPEANMRNWVIANTHMAAALKAKGYNYRFVLAKDAGHVDSRVVAQTLPEALSYIWEGYPIH